MSKRGQGKAASVAAKGTFWSRSGSLTRIRVWLSRYFVTVGLGFAAPLVVLAGGKLSGMSFGLGGDAGFSVALWFVSGVVVGAVVEQRVLQARATQHVVGGAALLMALSALAGGESVQAAALGSDFLTGALPLVMGAVPGAAWAVALAAAWREESSNGWLIALALGVLMCVLIVPSRMVVSVGYLGALRFACLWLVGGAVLRLRGTRWFVASGLAFLLAVMAAGTRLDAFPALNGWHLLASAEGPNGYGLALVRSDWKGQVLATEGRVVAWGPSGKPLGTVWDAVRQALDGADGGGVIAFDDVGNVVSGLAAQKGLDTVQFSTLDASTLRMSDFMHPVRETARGQGDPRVFVTRLRPGSTSLVVVQASSGGVFPGAYAGVNFLTGVKTALSADGCALFLLPRAAAQEGWWQAAARGVFGTVRMQDADADFVWLWVGRRPAPSGWRDAVSSSEGTVPADDWRAGWARPWHDVLDGIF